MNLKEQQYVVALADYGSIVKAAEHLGITQPALSSYLKNLEGSLNVKLFERSEKRFLPTEAGRLYVEKARSILRLQHELDILLADVSSGRLGRLRIGLQVRRAPWLIPSLLKVFSHYYPYIAVTLEESHISTLEEMLLDDRLDIMLANTYCKKKEFDYLFVREDRVLLAVAQEHPLARSGRKVEGCPYPWIDLQRFQNEKFILNQPDQHMRRTANKVLALSGVTPKKTMLVRSTEACVQLAAEGLGVCFTMESYARRTKYHKNAVFFSIGDPIASSDFMVVYRKGVHLPEYIMQFVDLLREIF